MENRILEILTKIGRPMGPTEIGLELGYDYVSASSAVTPSLKKLVKKGLVIRYAPTTRKVTYGKALD